ncbi:MAG TPA: glycosyltransferase family 4 protein [Terriglobales bacterium]|nr:glycosyltransferase family 4 protein [Terriglobales bacterium]
MPEWHIITCEYPPRMGGVADYSYLLAGELARRGDSVHVWYPPDSADPLPRQPGVRHHPEMGSFSPRDLRHAGALLEEFPHPRRILLQWVPHGYGRRSMNLAFCRWIAARARKGDLLDLMIHEPFLSFSAKSWRQNLPAALHRVMTSTLLKAANRVFISIPAWEPMLRPYAPPSLPFVWLPIPSTVPVFSDPGTSATIRARYLGDDQSTLIGHLGTYGNLISGILRPALQTVLTECSTANVLQLGRGSDAEAQLLSSQHPQFAGRIHGGGRLSSRELSLHLAACDLMLQPYPDGASSRRTSLMACLSHGLPVVSTLGKLSEDLWGRSNALLLAPAASSDQLVAQTLRLLADSHLRRQLGTRAREFYREHFDWPVVLNRLCESPVTLGV